MRVCVEVGDPGAEPGRVHCVLAACAGVQGARGDDAVVVVGGEVYGVVGGEGDEGGLAAQLVGLVFEVAEDVFGVPFTCEGEQAGGHVLADGHRLDVQRDV